MISQNQTLSFRVSSGLKNIIGRDLINDKFIAIFELVKNSYDANANKVNITFQINERENNKIIIEDDGYGMTYDDIVNKWLFVAYSEKKSLNKNIDYHDNLKRTLAGAKGVGRFSCDRLGEKLTLVTKSELDKKWHKITIDWNTFERDETEEFVNIPVQYTSIDTLPDNKQRGTILIIEQLREEWDRDSLLKLKRSLMKLVSPDAYNEYSPFEIEILVPSEIDNDNKAVTQKNYNEKRDTVNGIIYNDIFERLDIKTTSIEISIQEDGQIIRSILNDRGDDIFTVEEKNRDYIGLQNINIRVFYLNQSAKNNFTRQMGVEPKNYGSIFIYKNGFRINPYGESGQDFFGIDQRKAQGYNRYLGTREIMGRIVIKGDNDKFIETSSRDHGFVETKEVKLLSSFFVEKVLKVLEKYVVNIIEWSKIQPEKVGYQDVFRFVSNIYSKDIIEVKYNITALKKREEAEQKDGIEHSIKSLFNVAEKTDNSELYKLTQNIKDKTEKIINQQKQLEQENADKEKEIEKTKKENQSREKQIYFLKGATKQDTTNLINGFHSIYTLTDATKGNIESLHTILSDIDFDQKTKVLSLIDQIHQANDKAHKISDLAIHGNQKLKQKGVNRIYDFINQYIDAQMTDSSLKYEVAQNSTDSLCKFDVSSMAIIIDNIVSNSIKAGATRLQISIYDESQYICIDFTDNGIGLDPNIDVDTLFEWGFSANKMKKGYGIGLNHIKQLVTEMKGLVEIDKEYNKGFKLVVKLRK